MEKEWYNKSVKEIEEELKTDKDIGLHREEVENRQQNEGFNELKETKRKSTIVKFLEQFKDFMIIVLIIAAIVSGVINQINNEGMADTIIILVVIIANAMIGVVQENRTDKSQKK